MMLDSWNNVLSVLERNYPRSFAAGMVAFCIIAVPLLAVVAMALDFWRDEIASREGREKRKRKRERRKRKAVVAARFGRKG